MILAVSHYSKHSARVSSLAGIMAKLFFLGLMAVSFVPPQVAASDNIAQFSNSDHSLPVRQEAVNGLSAETQSALTPKSKRVDFGEEPKSRNAQHLADWILDSGDNRGLPFVIVDKIDAKAFVFYADGRLRGAGPILLGVAKGDDNIPGIGERKLSQIPPKDRVTPAGRFLSSMGLNAHGKDVFWVDYDGAVAIHRVVTNNPKEHRLERLASRNPLDRRISFGCINVPVKFFEEVVSPTFTGTQGISYVLPDTRSLDEIFKSYYDVESRRGTGTASNLGEGTMPATSQQDLGVGSPRARP